MGIINSASANSVWRGIDYQNRGKVISCGKIDEFIWAGEVLGSAKEVYHVVIDTEHVRKSKCDCLFAKDSKKICKHMVALYFEAFPNELESFLNEAAKAEAEYESYQKELYNNVIKHIESMPKNDLQNALIFVLDLAPEWVYEKFVRYYTDYRL